MARTLSALLVFALVGPACTSAAEVETGATDPAVSAVAAASGRVFDLPDKEGASASHGDYFPAPETPFAQAALSDLVFVGSVAGYTEAVYLGPGDAEDPSGLNTLYDGIELDVHEVLKGDEQLRGDTATVMTPVQSLEPSGEKHQWLYETRVLDLETGSTHGWTMKPMSCATSSS